MNQREHQRDPQDLSQLRTSPPIEVSVDAREAIESLLAKANARLGGEAERGQTASSNQGKSGKPFNRLEYQLNCKADLLTGLLATTEEGARISPKHLEIIVSEIEQLSHFEASQITPFAFHCSSTSTREADTMRRIEGDLRKRYAKVLPLLTALINASLTR